jgi:hypothetical protein
VLCERPGTQLLFNSSLAAVEMGATPVLLAWAVGCLGGAIDSALKSSRSCNVDMFP